VDEGFLSLRAQEQAQIIADALGITNMYRVEVRHLSLVGRLTLLSSRAMPSSRAIRSPNAHSTIHKGVKRAGDRAELQNITVFLVHLAVTFGARHQQLGDLYSLVKARPSPTSWPAISTPVGDPEIRLFLAAPARNATRRPSLPSPSWAPRRQLDFVLHSPEIRISAAFLSRP